MKKFFKEFYRSVDDSAVPGEDITLEDLLADDSTEDETPPDTGPLTRDQIADMMAQNNADLIAQFIAAQPKPVAKEDPKPDPIVPPFVPTVDPSVLAQRTMIARDVMMGQVAKAYPDLGPDEVAQIRETLLQFETLDQVKAAQKDNYHMSIADAIAGGAIRSGKYVPAAWKEKLAAPVGGAAAPRPPAQNKLTTDDQESINFVNSVIGSVSPGLKLTAEAYARSQKHLARVGKHNMVRN